MANMCTNILFCKTENAENYKKVLDFLEEKFEVDFVNEDEDGNYFESEFYSKWSFAEEEFNTLIKSLTEDETLYIRILSHELCCEYASFRIYKNGSWDIRF